MQVFGKELFMFTEMRTKRHILSSLTYWKIEVKERMKCLELYESQLSKKKNGLQSNIQHNKD